MSSPGAIDWEFAQRVADRVARRDGYLEIARGIPLEAQFSDLSAQAEELVAATTGLPRSSDAVRARVTDRTGWVAANVASFQRLMRPLTDKFDNQLDGKRFTGITRRVAGLEAGALLGWMSGRVLGQYDLLIIEDDRPEDQDVVYYVGPNIVALESQYAFPPNEFRLWIAIHECTHRAQFTGVPWLRPYFLSQVDTLLREIDPDPDRLREGLRAAFSEARSSGKRFDRGGLAAVIATPRQREIIDRIGGLMSLLEGHGDVIMSRAAAGLVPSANRFERVLTARRQSARGLQKFVQKVTGIEAKLTQYAAGAKFIAQVEAAGGLELFDRVWRGPEWLPNMDEIRDPQSWIDRVHLSEAVGA